MCVLVWYVVCLRVCHDLNVKYVHPLSVLTLSPPSSSLLGCIHASISGFCYFQLCSLCLPLWPLVSSPADGVDEEVGRFVHHVQEVNQFKKVAMTQCRNLSPSLIAAICVGLCSSSMEELVVTSPVSVLSVCLTTPFIQTAFYCN